MRSTATFIFLLFQISFFQSCDKNSAGAGCAENTAITRQLNNATAKIEKMGSKFYIVEQGTIDTKLNPCSLAEEFRINNLPVIVSGNVKQTKQLSGEPCCIEDFEITKISK